ncbi:MAG: DUF3667 domain-containing protein [Erythrobacter sp.]|uniref:DUF3667 domain-containing protein n=1 Tax=Erythrobacter sp. TaxID=1042 RepID=UPI0032EED2B6
MNEISEGLGGIVEGALAGGAVEPESGRARTIESTTTCANCGTVFSGNYCPDCGQKARIHRTLTAIGHDLVHGVLHLDGKLSRTLPLLAFKPGKLTRRYIEGERARFVSPMSMFLFSVFAMFAVFQMVGIGVPTTIEGGGTLNGTSEIIKRQGTTEIERIERELAALEPDDPLRAELEEDRNTIARTIRGIDEIDLERPDTAPEININVTGIEKIDKGLIKKWRENPGLMLYKLQANGYKFSWLLIPLSIPFVWLLFAWRRRFKAYDHAIFVTYSLAFMSLLFIALSLVNAVGLGLGWAAAMFVFAAPLHLYKHLRHSYGLSRFSTVWRFFALLFFILVVVMLFLQALLLLGGF